MYKNFLSLLFKFCYNLQSFVYKIIILKVVPIRKDNIAVLAKGKSLKFLYSKFNYKIKNLDLLILTNFKNNDILDFFLKKYISEIPVTILGNITEPLMSLISCYKLKIYEVYVQRFLSKKPNTIGLNSKRKNFRLNSYGLKVNYLNKYVQNYYYRFKNQRKHTNCGLFGVLLACSYKPKNIFIFGIDFYETEYFNMKLLKNMDLKEKKRLYSLKEWYKKFLIRIIKDHAQINFIIFTSSNFKYQSKNLKIYQNF